VAHDRRAKWVPVAVGVAVGVLLSLAGLAGSWVPLTHSTCKPSAATTTGTFFLPLALVNSPYGGLGYVNSTYPSQAVGYPPSSVVYRSDGGGDSNGTVWGSFLWDTATVSLLSNQTALGPGLNDRCSDPFALSLQVVPPDHGGNGYSGEIFDWPGGPEFGTGSPTDRGEPLMFNLSTSAGNTTSEFHNGFYEPNAASVTTCGGPAKSLPVEVNGLMTWISFTWDGRSYSTPTTLPLAEDFRFLFPANFGTWAVDNLSAPGGPGGGWAFSYTPCA
jgi:hypothetical protein